MSDRYLAAALAGELARVREAGEGGRHSALFAASASLGELVAAGGLSEELVVDELRYVAEESGLGRREVTRTVRDGLRVGKRNPRDLPERGAAPAPPRRPGSAVAKAAAPPRHKRPPPSEVVALWDSCRPVCDDFEVAAWLAARGIDPGTVGDRDLARALPRTARLPRWAACLGRPWTAGWRLLFRAWGPTGRVESLRARWVGDTPPSGWPKASAASAGEGSASGLVLADGLGQLVLAVGHPPEWWPAAPLEALILEGEPDWLSWTTATPDADLYAPAVFGVWQGAWNQTLASRVPDGTHVCLRTHLDTAGRGYAARVASTLHGRCRVFDLRERHGA